MLSPDTPVHVDWILLSIYHSRPRSTQDIDFVIETNASNLLHFDRAKDVGRILETAGNLNKLLPADNGNNYFPESFVCHHQFLKMLPGFLP